jgi:hypothetical protein
VSCGPSADHWGSGALLQIGLTSCLQSQIGQAGYLRGQGHVQVKVAVLLSVDVRGGPVMTAVNGTLVARPLIHAGSRAGNRPGSFEAPR